MVFRGLSVGCCSPDAVWLTPIWQIVFYCWLVASVYRPWVKSKLWWRIPSCPPMPSCLQGQLLIKQGGLWSRGVHQGRDREWPVVHLSFKLLPGSCDLVTSPAQVYSGHAGIVAFLLVTVENPGIWSSLWIVLPLTFWYGILHLKLPEQWI